MKTICIIVLFVVLGLCSANLQAKKDGEITSFCGFCEFAASNIEALIASNLDKQDALTLLKTFKENVCPSATTVGISKEECESWLDQNGRYTLDLLLSEEIISPASICTSLGICSNPQYQDVGKIIFPTFNEDSVKYKVEVADAKPQTTYSYRVFFGNPTFDYNTLAACFKIDDLEGIQVAVSIQDKTGSSLKNVVCEPDSDRPCRMRIKDVGVGVWYTVNVVTTDIEAEAEDDEEKRSTSRFTLKIREADSENSYHNNFHHWKKKCSGTKVLIGVLSALGFCCCCCLCCIVRSKRRCRRMSCSNKNLEAAQTKSDVQQDPQDIPLQPLETVDPMTINMQPVAVYYSPNVPYSFSPQMQYIQLEQAQN